MKYLESTKASDIKKNAKLKNIKAIFVDEAQDLNETQYKILCLLKQKNKTVINLIGDPNQNIYQFRGSSDKYLTNFQAKTFYLTYNFRSHQEVVEFSKYLRPNQDVDIICKKG
jgi:DNA helicase-2/ATP-dependent DNA helicase PcrA